MEWTKSNISGAELEQKQQAYIKEALEMAKRSKAQDDGALREQEKAAKEKKAAEERAEAERKAAEKKAAEEKAEAERKAAEEKAEAERKAAEKKAEAERKAANEKAEAEKAAKEKEEAAREKDEAAEEAEDNADDEAEELIDPGDFAELIGAEDIEDDDECGDDSDDNEKQDDCDDKDDGLIDTEQLAHTKKAANSSQKESAPANFNQYINQHNNKAQCNCPSCQRKRAMMGK